MNLKNLARYLTGASIGMALTSATLFSLPASAQTATTANLTNIFNSVRTLPVFQQKMEGWFQDATCFNPAGCEGRTLGVITLLREIYAKIKSIDAKLDKIDRTQCYKYVDLQGVQPTLPTANPTPTTPTVTGAPKSSPTPTTFVSTPTVVVPVTPTTGFSNPFGTNCLSVCQTALTKCQASAKTTWGQTACNDDYTVCKTSCAK